MSHMAGKSAYKKLEERLNRYPQGAPPSETLYRILNILFKEKEAGLVSQLPIKPFTVNTASRIWKLNTLQTEKILDELAGRAILLDSEYNGIKKYTLPPPMAGFFEFSMMRTRIPPSELKRKRSNTDMLRGGQDLTPRGPLRDGHPQIMVYP